MVRFDLASLQRTTSGQPHEVEQITKLLILHQRPEFCPLIRYKTYCFSPGSLWLAFHMGDWRTSTVATLDSPVEGSLDSGDSIVTGRLSPVRPALNPLRDVDAIKFGDRNSGAESPGEQRQVVLRLLVGAFGSICSEPVKVGIKKVRDRREVGLGTPTAAHQLVVLLECATLSLPRLICCLPIWTYQVLVNLRKKGFGCRILSLPSETLSGLEDSLESTRLPPSRLFSLQ